MTRKPPTFKSVPPTLSGAPSIWSGSSQPATWTSQSFAVYPTPSTPPPNYAYVFPSYSIHQIKRRDDVIRITFSGGSFSFVDISVDMMLHILFGD